MSNIDRVRMFSKNYWSNGIKLQKELRKNKISYIHGVDNIISESDVKPDPKYGYPILKNSAFCAQNGIVFAACLRLDNGKDIIMVDDMFDTLSDRTKEFIIYHEIGHIVHGDNDKIDAYYMLKRALCFSDVMSIELAADQYAIDKLGRKTGLFALLEMLQVAGFNLSCNKEYMKRLEQCLEQCL